jgi:hypothetical protein
MTTPKTPTKLPTAAEALARINQSAPLKLEDTHMHDLLAKHIEKAIADRVPRCKVYVGREPPDHVAIAIAHLTQPPNQYGARVDETGHLLIEFQPPVPEAETPPTSATASATANSTAS